MIPTIVELGDLIWVISDGCVHRLEGDFQLVSKKKSKLYVIAIYLVETFKMHGALWHLNLYIHHV